jgi:hypothetical protein
MEDERMNSLENFRRRVDALQRQQVVDFTDRLFSRTGLSHYETTI